MKAIILNEKAYAEECLRNGTLGDNVYHTLSILAKYYYSLGQRKKKITASLCKLLEDYEPDYAKVPEIYNEFVLKVAGSAGKYPLYEIDGVGITQKELDIIADIPNKVSQRLAFTYLCLAKLQHLKNSNSDGWVNLTDKDVFQLARISCTISERYSWISKLYKLGLLDVPLTTTNVRVTFMDKDEDCEPVLFVDDFRELGYEYLKYLGENYIRCAECGVLTKGNKNGTKRYCPKCVQYTPKETKQIICMDCGTEFTVSGSNKRTVRCELCRHEKQLEYQRSSMAKMRNVK